MIITLRRDPKRIGSIFLMNYNLLQMISQVGRARPRTRYILGI